MIPTVENKDFYETKTNLEELQDCTSEMGNTKGLIAYLYNWIFGRH